METKKRSGNPPASDLVDRLMDDFRAVFGEDDPIKTKALKNRFHISVRAARHQREHASKMRKRVIMSWGPNSADAALANGQCPPEK